MEDDAFENWFRKCFIPYIDKTNIDRPVLFIFDGHWCHIKYSIAQFANDMGVFVLSSTQFIIKITAFRCWSLWASKINVEENLE